MRVRQDVLRLLSALALWAVAATWGVYTLSERQSTMLKKTERAQWRALGMTQWRIDLSSQNEIRLKARLAEYFASKQETRLVEPIGQVNNADSKSYTFQALEGRMRPHLLELDGKAKIIYRKVQTDPVTLTGDQLIYYEDKHLLSSPKQVLITQRQHQTQGTGMDWHLDRQQLTLYKDVTSEILPNALP